MDYLKTTWGYSDDQALYGASAIDYFYEALQIANGTNSSYSGIFNLLSSYGFEYAEIEDACKAQNYDTKAANLVAEYYSSAPFFGIIEYLMNDGFTYSQAQYGAIQNGIYMGNDPCYQDGDAYITANPGCSQADFVSYLQGLGKYYSDTRILLVWDALQAAG